jgi:hypothetical protein
MAEADRDAKELKQSWNIIDERGDKVRSGQDTLVDLAANGLHLTAKNPNGPKLPAGSYSLQIGGANSLPFTVNAKIEDQNRQAQALPFDRELSFVSPRSELIGSRVPFKNIWEAQWNYHTLDGQAFEVAKIFIGMGKFFGFNLISEERAYSRQEKEARYREAVKWFSVAADNPFFQEAFDSHEEGNWLANPHRPDEFFLYRALGYKGRADANFGLFSLNGDKNCLYPAINDYREAIRLMDEYRRKAPGGFSLYTWEEKHTFYLTRIRLAAAYLEKFRQNQADRETLKVALNEIQRVNDEENMIKDQNIRLELYLTAVSIYAEIKERGLELGRYLNIPSPAALSDKLSFYQRKAEDILNGGGGYAHLQSLYSTLIDTGNGNLNYFYPVVEIEERCQGSGYAALQNCISLAKKETDPVKAVIRLRQILPKIGNSADKVKAELLSQLADTLMGLTQVQLESRSLRDSLTADYRDELKLAAHADPNFLAILTPLLSKDIAAFNHNELRLLIYCIAFNKVSEAIGLVPTIPPSKFKNMDTGKKGLMGILLNKRLDIVNNIR